MAYEPLHHKYRPQTFADLVGQEAIATTLTSAILQARIAPAYLFSGPRGTGKTSSARILAKSLNCQSGDQPTPTPCGVCEACRSIVAGNALDVIEIDAASNTGVDNIRELIEKAQFAPVQCRFKVYVIDECLIGNTLVPTKDGLMRIDDPSIQGKQVLSYNETSEEWEYRRVTRWFDQGDRQTLIIKTTHRTIQCTGNHLIRTDQGWIAARNVKEKAKILSPANVAAVSPSTSLGAMADVEDLRLGISSKEINMGGESMTSTLFSNRRMASGPSVPVVVKKNLRFRIFSKPRVEASQAFGLTGNDIPTKVARRPSNIFMSSWEPNPLASGFQIMEDTQFRPWSTNFEEVKSVEIATVEPVYDIEVEGNHNFVANGLLVHNCHMLSTAAFNALLKTLEEPPDRVVFVLATTDPQRVLPTIISRCQRFDYRRIPLESMVSHLRFIADQEAIEIEPEALTLVAQISQGGLRDAESLLDQLSLLPPPIRVEAVWDLVGAVPERDLLTLVEAIAANDPETVIDRARQLMNRGREPLIVLQNLASFYRDLLIAKSAPQRSDLVAITPSTWEQMVAFVQSSELTTLLQGQQHLRASEVQLKNTTQPRLWLEVTLLGLLPSAQVTASAPVWVAPSALPANSVAPVSPVPPVNVNSANVNPIASSPPVNLPDSIATTPQVASTPTPSTTPSAHSQPPPPVTTAGNLPPSDTSSGSSDTNTQADLTELWKRVVANVEFRSTQMLLRQQGHLLKLSGKAARVGINDRWISNLQGKLPAIEAAFAKTLGQPIKVNLEPVLPKPDALLDASPQKPAPPNSPTPPAPPAPPIPSAPPSQPPSSQPPSSQPPASQATPPLHPSTPPPSHPPKPPPPSPATQPLRSIQPPEAVEQVLHNGLSPESNNPDRPVPNLPVLNSPVPNLPIPSLPIPSLPEPTLPVPSLNAVWDEDELLRAAKSLAQFFNGEVVPPETEIVEAIAPFPSNDVLSPTPISEIFSSGISSSEVFSPNLPESSFLAEEDDDVPF